jgi:hypothetical protein
VLKSGDNFLLAAATTAEAEMLAPPTGRVMPLGR